MFLCIYVTFRHASRIYSGSRSGMLQFQAFASRSKNNFHSLLPCDGLLGGRGGFWKREQRRQMKELLDVPWSSVAMDYCSSWLTHASAVWIILTANGRMRLFSQKSLLLRFKRRNQSQASERLATVWIRETAFSGRMVLVVFLRVELLFRDQWCLFCIRRLLFSSRRLQVVVNIKESSVFHWKL